MSESRGPGQPRIVKTPERFDELVEEYRAQCKDNKEPLTFTGMALHLGFSCRQSFYQYKELEGYYDSVKRACSLIESQYERNLSGNNVAGSIFALKNHGWADKQELVHSGGGDPIAIAVTRRVVDVSGS